MDSDKDLIAAIVQAAGVWQDPEYDVREEAVRRTLELPNTFTAEATAFAVNQQMNLLNEDSIHKWIAGRTTIRPRTIGVLNAGNVPFVGLQDFLAVVLTGHRYFGTVSTKDAFLLPAFIDDLRRLYPVLSVAFGGIDDMYKEAEAVIATGTEETREWITAQNRKHGIDPSLALIRGHRYAVAVIDGQESNLERDNLAEDTLLHEGFGCRNVAVIWAPEGYAPDAVLESFAAFRGVFPAHSKTPGRLKMQQAFLEAMGLPHAFGDGLEFLLSNGDPDVQQPGHVRWAEYADLDEVTRWIAGNKDDLQLVIARAGLVSRIGRSVLIDPPGHAQRPMLDWCPDGIDTVGFLAGL